MNWDVEAYLKPKEAPAQEEHKPSGDWLTENVWHPMLNGSGVVQVYNTFSGNDIKPASQAETSGFGDPNWYVQTAASTLGAIVPYVLAGKVAGKVFGTAGEALGLRGTSARVVNSAALANILGAGAYDALKKPHEGETRWGNAFGTMAGFSVFEGGNHLIGKGMHAYGAGLNTASRIGVLTASRFAVGSLGGLASYETGNRIASITGGKDQRTQDGYFESMFSGGLLNVALPVVHKGAERAIDLAYNSRSYGPGVPIDRYMAYNKIADPEVAQTARWNPAARVKIATDGVTKADVQANRIHVREGADVGQVAHELRHLRIARDLEPHYKSVAEIAKIDPARAENQFYNMRAYAEFQARMMQGVADPHTTAEAMMKIVEQAPSIGDEIAGNGKTYRENWQQEWRQMQQDPKFRPRMEYAPDEGKTATATTEATRDIRVTTDPVELGAPNPLGATVMDNGINFAVRSEGANKMQVLLFDNAARATAEPLRALDLNRTGDVWHRFVPGLESGQTYLYRAFGSYNPAVDGTRFNVNMGLIDPYSKAVTGDSSRAVAYDNSNPKDPERHLRVGDGNQLEDMSKSVAVKSDFDWKGDKPPAHAMEDSVIYEMNVKGFTGGVEELGTLRGTYRGLVEKIPHLKRLGVTAVELMPVFQFEKIDNFNGTMSGDPRNPETGEPLRNQWGYQTLAYQAPEASYAADGVRGQQVDEFKYMVRELHKNNIEVLLDVVFNHTAEDGHLGPTISFRGLDNNVYYMLAPNAPEKYIDHTGCRNTLNVNDPAVRELILDTLRYWVKEMHVDGFRFDLATVFNYDVDNIDKPKTPVISEIENDPVLKHVKLIAEPWSIDQYKVGSFSDQRWSEWNGVFRDTVRKFLRSDGGVLKDLGERITGSRRWFDAIRGRHSINFVTAHDGFTLNDLFSYNEKHNFGNGERNNDGANDNYSSNYGVEGPTNNPAIEALRNRQVKNAFAMLFLSQGTPMMLAGDEFRRTTNGNNNYWPQEKLNLLDWSLAEKHADTVRFVEMMIKLRKEFQIGRGKPEDVTWHGTKPLDQNWGDADRYIAWEIPGPKDAPNKRLYSGFNSYWEPLEIELPAGKWRRRVDTNLPNGQEIVDSGEGMIIEGKYVVQPRTGVVFEKVE